MADAMMKSLGEANGVNWYWAEPGRFEKPGVYYWDGANNVLCVPYQARPEAPAQAAPSAGEVERSDGELWSFLRSVMSQGANIYQDYMNGRHATYEHYSARLDAAASSRVESLRAALASQQAGKGEPRSEQVNALLDGFDSLIATAEANDDRYAVGYVGAMKAAFERLVASPSSREPLTEWEARGMLARLKCWHRLTEQEADELVQFAMQGGIHMREVEPQWQPIETAPKDGKVVLLGYHNSHGNWRTMRGCWLSKDYIDEYWEYPEGVDAGWFETPVEAEDPPNCWPTDPTHWMPLPPPPGIHSRGEGEKA